MIFEIVIACGPFLLKSDLRLSINSEFLALSLEDGCISSGFALLLQSFGLKPYVFQSLDNIFNNMNVISQKLITSTRWDKVLKLDKLFAIKLQ